MLLNDFGTPTQPGKTAKSAFPFCVTNGPCIVEVVETQALVAVEVILKNPPGLIQEVVSYVWVTKGGGGCLKVVSVPSPQSIVYDIVVSVLVVVTGRVMVTGAQPFVPPGLLRFKLAGFVVLTTKYFAVSVQPLSPVTTNFN